MVNLQDEEQAEIIRSSFRGGKVLLFHFANRTSSEATRISGKVKRGDYVLSPGIFFKLSRDF